MNFSFVIIPWDESKPLQQRSAEHVGAVETPMSLDLFRQTTAPRLMEDNDILYTPLLLPSSRDNTPGLYAFYATTTPDAAFANIRATRLAMACGLFSKRFHGTVLLVRAYHPHGSGGWSCVTIDEVYGACCISPDLRNEVLQSSLMCGRDDVGGGTPTVPEWLGNAAKQNYHDMAIVSRLMTNATDSGTDDRDGGETSDSSGEVSQANDNLEFKHSHDFVAQSTLCLHCRGPSHQMCADCEGAYFCPHPRTCRQIGWSHRSICATWKLYTQRRSTLSSFPFHGWHLSLVDRESQISEEPCRRFLQGIIGVALDQSSWWRTEIGGWSGGDSDGARTIDIARRWSYTDGFAPLTDVPCERHVTIEEVQRAQCERNACGLMRLDSWEQYYRLRGLPLSTPVALLLTFPLTIYRSIVCHGEVPVTVARMLQRPLRIHVVGVEKELNFLDLFKEVGYLLPDDLDVELVFVVRHDMFPRNRTESTSQGESFKTVLTKNLTLSTASGIYGDTLDPSFDCGSGPPDMVMGMNAGLFAYESWRSVITYLHHHTGVVGVFTDYNEHSGMNCASLAGMKTRESLTINPFRQPRAMPVFSMNLPQFGNGFMYVFNQQELE